MKKYLFLAAVALLVVSCGKKKSQEEIVPSEETILAAETVLADEVLAIIDDIANEYLESSDNVDVREVILSSLSDKDKLVKPEYLLDPAVTNDLLTNIQKVSAMAFLACEKPVRIAYGLPVDEVDKALASLAADINFPVGSEGMSNLSMAERCRKIYDACKEKGELVFFWQYSLAVQAEFFFLISRDPGAFLDNIDGAQYLAYQKRIIDCIKAATILAEYDVNLADALVISRQYNKFSTDEEMAEAFSSIESAKKYYIETKDAQEARRAAFLSR